MLNVLFTTDVEIWPTRWELSPKSFETNFEQYIYGSTNKGTYGLPYMLSLFQEYGFNTVFFVEALFAGEFGVAPLKEIVDLITDGKQSVEMHLHPEWVGKASKSILPGKSGTCFRDFSLDDQLVMLRSGLEHFEAVGVEKINAFRAGSYGGNVDTLKALCELGIPFDSSYNATALGATSDYHEYIQGPATQPFQLESVWEFPISHFQDRPGNLRHAQLGACSASEMCAALMSAWRNDWKYFVVVSHSFELLTLDKTRRDAIVVRRLHRLLKFFDRHRDKFNLITFADLVDKPIERSAATPLRSSVLRTAHRFAEQGLRRAFQ